MLSVRTCALRMFARLRVPPAAVLVVPLMLLLPGVFGLGADGVYWSEPISDLLGGGAAFTTLMLTVYRPLAKELKEETLCQN